MEEAFRAGYKSVRLHRLVGALGRVLKHKKSRKSCMYVACKPPTQFETQEKLLAVFTPMHAERLGQALAGSQNELTRTLKRIFAETAQYRYVREASAEREACSICLQLSESPEVAVTPCGHSFCPGCLGRWFHRNRNCPLCKRPMPKPADSKRVFLVDRSTNGD